MNLMVRPREGRKLTFAGTAIVFLIAAAFSQNPATIADQYSTAERVKHSGWWPTKGTAPASDYAGAQACLACHSSITQSQSQTRMGRTSLPAISSKFLDTDVKFSQGPFTYQVSRLQQHETYTVSNGTLTFSAPLPWAVGSGNNGQSYLFQNNGSWYEARISWFNAFQRFDVTPDHPTVPADSMEKAIGRRISADEAPKCFGCHTTESTTSDRFDPAHAVAGITCEVCHGPGAAHVATSKAGLNEAGASLIVNLHRMNPVDSVDFCGACHRTWWDVNLAGLTGPGTIRFPAYRLEKSRCWGKGDARVTCVGCHSPHELLVRDAASYDARCLNCHLANVTDKPNLDHPGPACPAATHDCVTCHMPKYELPTMHTKFTDHMIRIVRKDEPFPD
jgi:hypothetical protein